MKVTIIVRSRFLGYHPGQIVILEDTPRIRRLISSGHAELVWSDQEDLHGSNKASPESKEHRPAVGQRDRNGTKPEGGSSSGGSSTDSTQVGSKKLSFPLKRDSGELDSQGVRDIKVREEID